jgi:ribosomal-protein-alanine N-acetyltransferase
MQQQSLFNPFPVLTTSRLRLRKITHADAQDIYLMRSDPEVMRYIPRPLATCVEDAVKVIDLVNGFIETEERINWAMELKETGQVIGMIGYVNRRPEHNRAEVGYSLNRAFHRKGLMYEALIEVIRYGFQEMKLHSIEAIIDAENEASGSLLKKAGFRQEAFFREDFLHNGVYRNSVHFGLLHADLVNVQTGKS